MLQRRRANRLARTAVVAAATLPLTLTLAGCGGSSSHATTASPARCDTNRAAGTITYLTGFQYQGDTGILDVLEAQASGLYRDECLSVVIRPGTGDPGTAAQLVASGRAQLGEVGGASDVITVADNGIAVEALATYGNVPSVTLLTTPQITDLTQLEGRTLGYKGAMPPEVTAMLQKAGVDVAKVHEVGVGYDPTILPRGQVSALTAYKSNEPLQLRADHFAVTEWDPDHFGIRGTFNTIIANPAWVKAHPTAAQDFLRATFHAYAACVATPAPCVAAAAKASGAGYDSAQNEREWAAQTAEVTASQPAGTGLGSQSVSQWQPEASLLLADGLIKKSPDLAGLIDEGPLLAIEHGATLVWPAPTN